MLPMIAHREHAEMEGTGDLFACFPKANELQHFFFSAREVLLGSHEVPQSVLEGKRQRLA
jgi:hypothetical protein